MINFYYLQLFSIPQLSVSQLSYLYDVDIEDVESDTLLALNFVIALFRFFIISE